MKNWLIAFLMVLSTSFNYFLDAQCTPPSADECEDASVLCSLSEVNGYCCQNTNYSNPTGCSPLCPSGGAPHNTGWWAFVTQGGAVSITITFSNCSVNGTGVQMGIWGDCNCGESIFCNPACNGPGSFTLSGNLQACKTYYLFVDGCSGDVCDFCLSTSGGNAPMLPPLGNIQGMRDVCVGACNIRYTIGTGGSCEPTYEWTLDGNEVGSGTGEITLDFPDEGDFQLCVTAYIGNPQSGSICDQEGPVCITIRARPIPDRIAPKSTLCFEQTPFRWHSNTITASGEYRQQFTDRATCCKYDSVKEFVVLEVPEPPDVYYLGCIGDTYVDPLTRVTFSSCQFDKVVNLPKSTDPWRCDSSYKLNAIFINYNVQFREYCAGGVIVIEGRPVDRTITCGNSGLTQDLQYKWYLKSDPARIGLGFDDRLEVDKKDEYCMELTVTANFGDKSKTCVFDFCEQWDEDQFKPYDVCPKGDQLVCQGKTGIYFVDTILPQGIFIHNWVVSGGTIITPKGGIDTTAIEVLWNSGAPVGQVCYNYISNCGDSKECCIDVTIAPAPAPKAGPDEGICGLSNQFKGQKDRGGMWTQLSGPNANILDPSDPNSLVNVNTYGSYTFVYTEFYLGCVGSDTVTLLFNDDPVKGPVTYICNANNKDYTYNFQISGGQPGYSVIKGNGTVNSTTNIYTSGVVQNLAKDTVIIRDANGCEFTFIHDYECKCTNSIGILQRENLRLCEDELVTIKYDKTFEVLDQTPKDTVIFFIHTIDTNALGSRIRSLNNLTFGFDPSFMVFGQTYYVSAILGRTDSNGWIDAVKGCSRTEGPTAFTFFEIPRPTAGIDQSICDVEIDLNGFKSLTQSSLLWEEVGGRAVLFSDVNAPQTKVTALDGYGTYVFRITENNNDVCITTDLVEITFNANPEIENVEPECVFFGAPGSKDGKFVVDATIKNGLQPYTLLTPNGQLIGNQWVSDTLFSLDTFRIQVQDANGCVSELIIDLYNCNCDPIDAGILDSLLTRVCEDECVPIKNLVPEMVNAAQDIAMYILHTGTFNFLNASNRLDTLSANDVVCFDAARMTLGQPVNITRIVGEDIAPRDGLIDDKDPCKRVSNPQSIIWEPYPLADAGRDNEVCGLNYSMTANLPFGTGFWRQLTGPGLSVIADNSLPGTNITVPGYGTYSFEWQASHYNCVRLDTMSITFLDAPEFDRLSYTFECDPVAENYRVRVNGINGDRPSWSVLGYHQSNPLNGSFSGNTWVTDWIPQSENFILTIRDKNNCDIDTLLGSEPCLCITRIGNLNAPRHLCKAEVVQASYGQGVLDPNDVVRYQLIDTTGGVGTILEFNDNGSFSFDGSRMVSGKTYYIYVFVGNQDPRTGNVDFGDRCLQSTVIPVSWYDDPVAAITGPTELTCRITSIQLSGLSSQSESGDPLTYQWTASQGGQVNPGQSGLGTIDVSLPGTYTLEVTDPRAGCKHQTSIVVTQDIVKPTVAIRGPQVLTCDVLSVDLDGTGSSQGGIYTATWTGAGPITGSNTYTASVGTAGRYVLTVENTRTGCLDSLAMNVLQDIVPPLADINPIGQLTCTVNQIQLDASGSRGNSGTISRYTWTGAIIGGQGTSTVTVGKPGGRFIVEVKDSRNGCVDTDTIDITEIGNPLADLLVDPANPTCFGDRNGRILISEVLDVNNAPMSNVEFSFNGGPFSSNRSYTNLAQGNYRVTVRDPNGCLMERTFSLIEPTKMGIEVIRSVVVDQGDPVNVRSLLVEITGGTLVGGQYRDTTWFNLDESIDWESKLIYEADTTREFLITGIDSNGCEISERVRVIVRIIKDVWWPTVISSNQDNTNDFFNVYGKRVRNVRKLQVYDRWGSMVYSRENLPDGNKNPQVGWNGTFKGERALPGVYVFYAEVEYEGSTGYEEVKGDFTLVR
ncbi:MAG: gliding motility-associated C-terminal domain-containing protein [Saprospiraceae bacterium]|nr:gliding motility-associated C-terminal domain-containing protein [Saprospiraceae bacterium]